MRSLSFAIIAAGSEPAKAPVSIPSDAYMNREPQIRDLTHMAELARFHAINTFGSNSPDETEEGKRERAIALFAVVHVEANGEGPGESLGRRRSVWSAIPGERKRRVGSVIADERAASAALFHLACDDRHGVSCGVVSKPVQRHSSHKARN